MVDSERYQFPIVIRSNQVYQYSLFQMMNWAASRGGRGRGNGHSVRISVLDFHCPSGVAGDERIAEVIPEMPMLRMALGGKLTLNSLRPHVGGGAGSFPAVISVHGFDSHSNPYLELFLDTSSLSVRPVTIFPFLPTDAEGLPPSAAVVGTIGSDIGDLVFLAPTSTFLWVVQDSWLDQMFYAITSTNVVTANEAQSPSIRFSNSTNAYLQMPPGTSTGGGSVVPPLPLEPHVRASSAATPASNYYFDVGFLATAPLNTGYIGSPTQQTVLRGYTLGIVLSSVAPATNDTSVWSTHLNPTSFTQYLSWCPQTKRTSRVASLLIDVTIT
jgi:hypothetical protein